MSKTHLKDIWIHLHLDVDAYAHCSCLCLIKWNGSIPFIKKNLKYADWVWKLCTSDSTSCTVDICGVSDGKKIEYFIGFEILTSLMPKFHPHLSISAVCNVYLPILPIRSWTGKIIIIIIIIYIIDSTVSFQRKCVHAFDVFAKYTGKRNNDRILGKIIRTKSASV